MVHPAGPPTNASFIKSSCFFVRSERNLHDDLYEEVPPFVGVEKRHPLPTEPEDGVALRAAVNF